MLVFGMKEVDYVVIDGNILVRMKWDGNDAKLCIEAPREVIIERDRVYEKRCLREGKKPRWELDKLVKNKRRYVSGPPVSQITP